MRYRFALILVVAAALGAALMRHAASVQAKGAPTLTIALTSNDKGVLESCGCGAIKFGGIPERAQMLVDLRKKLGSSLVILDSGDTFNFGDGPQKSAAMAKCLQLMGYQAVNFGGEEAATNLAEMRKAAPPDRFPWVATNLVEKATGKPPFPTYRVVKAGAVRLGVLGILPTDWRTNRSTSGQDDISVTDPVSAVRRAMAALRGKADLVVLLSAADPKVSRQVVDAVPGIALVLGGNRIVDVPHAGPFGKSYFAQAEGYCHNLMLLTLQRGSSWRVVRAAPQRVIYKAKRYAPVAKLAQQYLQSSNQSLEELISRTYGQSPGYEGDQKCQSCHPAIHQSWLATKHPQAWETLKKAGHRYDPDCLDCHTTGQPGKPSTALKGVQCEACHGPYAQHDSFAKTQPQTDAEWAKVCGRCHNEQRSPGFTIEKYLPRVKHAPPAGE